MRFKGPEQQADDEFARLKATKTFSVLDETPSKMLLVNGTERDIRKVLVDFPFWVLANVSQYELPDTRKYPKRSEYL